MNVTSRTHTVQCLIYFREMNLLADETRTKAFGLEDINRLVSHALSQQWFGNLVTPATWDSAWLKDSFATFFQFKVVDLVRRLAQ